MDPTDDLVVSARQQARRLASTLSMADAEHPDLLTYPSEPAPLIEASNSLAQVAQAASALRQEALECVDCTPSLGWALARVADELARATGDTCLHAETALTLTVALNVLGHFRDALEWGGQAIALFRRCCNPEGEAVALCETAWAKTLIGQLGEARQDILDIRKSNLTIALQARCDRVEARVARDQGDYARAETLFTNAQKGFAACQLPLQVARCERELARTLIFVDRDPSALLEHARQTFASFDCPAELALCDWVHALYLSERNDYAQSLDLLQHTRRKFADLAMAYFVATCDQELGIVYRHLNRFEESLQTSHQARNYFLAQGIPVDVAACDINLGNTYFSLNQYDEALRLYQEAADLSLAEGRAGRAARIYSNMALAYAQQGLFSKSIALSQRALEIAAARNTLVLAAQCHVNLSAAYRRLGQYGPALEHLQSARHIFAEYQLREHLADCTIELAEVQLARGETQDAAASLEQARQICEQEGFDSLVAACNRLLAQLRGHQDGERESALALLEAGRAIFHRHHQIVDAGLCDLTEGELHLAWGERGKAEGCFRQARALLSPGFPDQVWRADYGLARCHMGTQDAAAALTECLRAVRTIAQSRSMLVTEQLSNDFFARRQSVYVDALALSLQVADYAATLEVIEASKARSFLTLLENRGWKLRETDDSDSYLADLFTRERTLRYQLDVLRQRVAVQAEKPVGEVLRGSGEITAISGAALEELNATSQAYETVITQLHLAERGLAGVSVPAPFSLERFCASATARFGSNWVALDYYVSGNELVTATVSPQGVSAEKTSLSDYGLTVLDKCTSTAPDLRELIYRGTLRGDPVPSPGNKYLQHLYRLLIPEGLEAPILIVSPHRLLHALPFQALMDGPAYLIEKHTVLYAPNLQVAGLLMNASDSPRARHPLVFGVSAFGNSLTALPHARAEVEQLRQVFANSGEYFSEENATRQKLFELDASGELPRYGLLHFATHAVLDRTAPHQSGIVLSDEALTTADVMDLNLAAQLVTLSACQTALGQGGDGDEFIGLARAFFYAGAQAILATLWSVEDGSITELIGRVYRQWMEGRSIAEALRSAQCEMIAHHHTPYQWAPFVLIGRP